MSVTQFLIRFDGLISFYSAVSYWIMLGREAVLRMNGSNVRGWWFAHHLLGMLLSALSILWDKSEESGYFAIRKVLYPFYLYLGVVQILQYRYQMSRLYALRALNRIDPMETTNELAQNVIHHNLLFLLPFLIGAYALEFYVSWLIFGITRPCLLSRSVGGVYFILASGNTLTTCYTYYKKLAQKPSNSMAEKKSLLVREFSKSSDDLKAAAREEKLE